MVMDTWIIDFPTPLMSACNIHSVQRRKASVVFSCQSSFQFWETKILRPHLINIQFQRKASVLWGFFLCRGGAWWFPTGEGQRDLPLRLFQGRWVRVPQTRGNKKPGQLVNVGLDFEFLLIRKKRCPNLTDFIAYIWLDGLKPPTRTVLRCSEVTHVWHDLQHGSVAPCTIFFLFLKSLYERWGVSSAKTCTDIPRHGLV